jgi:hypothetical protein
MSALRYLPSALRSSTDLFKGLEWKAALRRSDAPLVKNVSQIEALGNGRVEAVRYRSKTGWSTQATETLLVHEGVVPQIHAALSLDCEIEWSQAQDCFLPVLDDWGESSRPDLFITGDGAGIAGAKAAELRGQLAGIRVAAKLGRIHDDAAAIAADPIRRKLTRELAIRPFLDAMFKPRREVFAPADATIVCRCEEVTAGEIRNLANVGRPGPGQMKTATRVGMGPCQGRQCGYSVVRILADAQQRAPSDVGFFHVRPPLKPVTIGELASLNEQIVL